MSDQVVLNPIGGLRRRNRRRRFGNPLEWLVVLIAVTVAIGAVGTAVLLIGQREFARRIFPSISVRGVPVGGMRPDDAHAAIEAAYGDFLANPVEISYAGRLWRPAAEDIGLTLAIDEALDQAFALGRGVSRADSFRFAAAAWEHGVDLPLRLQIDQPTLQRYLMRVAAEVELPPQNADIDLRGPQVILKPEVWGTQVLVDETLAEITSSVQSLEPGAVALRTRTLEPRQRNFEFEAITADLNTLLAGPLVIEGSTGACADMCRWEISPERIAGWIGLRRGFDDLGKPTVSINIDQDAIRNTLRPLANAVRVEGTLPLVAWNGGNLIITRPGLTGLGLDADQALALVNQALRSSDRLIPLPMVDTPPPVNESNLAALGIVGQVGYGVSSFANSAEYRITNIRAGARRMNGALVPPGATFSFNDQLGEVNAEGGFVEGYAIVDNRTQKEWGGGLCQVSTTVFRAAFFGGLPISERHEHAFRISWYEELGEPPGLDAAIFTPYNDMRFVNDTGSWLLVESYVDLQRQRLSVALYGTPTGREVAYEQRVLERTPAPTRPVYVDDPTKPRGYTSQSDTARGGITVEVIRTVLQNGQLLSQDTFPTEFKPWPDIFVRGTGG